MQILKSKNLKEIIIALRQGAVLVLPTDTVYGLVCDASNKKAVEKIFKIKKRNKTKALPIFVKDIKMAKKYAVISKGPASAKDFGEAKQEKIIKKYWPGKYTLVLGAKNKTLSPLVYKKNTIAVRQPDYKLIIDVTKLLKKPLAQSSANISDSPATTKMKDIFKYFESQKCQPDLIVGAGNLPRSKPSAIIDLTKGNIKFLRK